MKTKKALSFATSMVLFLLLGACDLLSDDEITFDIDIEVTVVESSSSSGDESGIRFFRGSKNVQLSEIKELKGVKKMNITNAMCSPSIKKGRDYYAVLLRVESGGVSVDLPNDAYLSDGDKSATNELVTFMEPVVENLINNKSVSISVLGITNILTVGEKFTITLTVEQWDGYEIDVAD
jgi:hypothetical protein